jgi:hypothetical protein
MWKRRLVLVPFVVLVAGAALAGCGGDDSAAPVPLDAGVDAAKTGSADAATGATKDAQGDPKDAAAGG